MTVEKKVVVITGAAGGLGTAMTEVFLSKGAFVWALDFDENKQAILREKFHADSNFHSETLDVTSESAWKRVIQSIMDIEKRVDVLINNAGINIRKPLEEMAKAEWMKMMEVNTGGVFLGCREVLPIFRKQGGGLILNMSSVCGLIGHEYTPEAYTATKGAITLLTKSIAARYGREGIRCNSLHPSTVETDLVAEAMKDPLWKAQRYGEVPLGRLATPNDVAQAALYLASDEADFLNGISLPVDGGVTCK